MHVSKFSKPARVSLLFGVLVAANMLMSGVGASAQGTQQMPTGLLTLSLCSSMNYADIAAKVVSLSTTDLRKALASGKKLQDIATAQNVTSDELTKALQDARKAEVDQAVKDGMLSQQDADVLQTMPQTVPGAGFPGQSRQNGAPNNFPLPSGTMPANLPGLAEQSNPQQADPLAAQYNITPTTQVPIFQITALALNMSCSDLVKSLLADSSHSIATLAMAKNIDVKTVTAALVKAYQDAAAQDVNDGLITQTQLDAQKVDYDKLVSDFVNATQVSSMAFPMPVGTPAQ